MAQITQPSVLPSVSAQVYPRTRASLVRGLLDDRRPVSRPLLLAIALLVTIAYALLWSPNWYPLSDSALYLSLGRSLANGQGFTFMGLPYKRVTPLTPVLLAGIMKMGGGI